MLLIADYSGAMIFNGAYARPSLSWKIEDLWRGLDRNAFHLIQILNDTILQVFYFTLPNGTMLIADYERGLNAKDIRWSPWSADFVITTIALIKTNQLVLGS